MKRQCYICGATQGLHDHHIWMQAAGGENAPTVPLCATDHKKIHDQALNLESKGPKHIVFTEQEWPRAKKLVEYLQLAIRKNRQNPDFNDPYQLQVRMTKRDVFMLHLAKDEAGYKNLQSFIRDMLRGYIHSKYPGA